MTADGPGEAPHLEPELMDGPLPYREAAEALGDLDRVNRRLLGDRAARRCLAPRLAALVRATSTGGAGRAGAAGPNGPGEPTLRLLDVGTGSGQTVDGVLGEPGVRRALEASPAALRVVGVDRRLAHLVFGRARRQGQGRHRRGRPPLRPPLQPHLRVVADAAALPFRDGAFDWSLSTLFFHHFDGAGNRRILAEMQRVSRRGAAVVDLRPSPWAEGLRRLLFALLRVGPVASHDGRLSLAQSWSLERVRELAGRLPSAGFRVTELRRRFPFRWSLVLERDLPETGPQAERGPKNSSVS